MVAHGIIGAGRGGGVGGAVAGGRGQKAKVCIVGESLASPAGVYDEARVIDRMHERVAAEALVLIFVARDPVERIFFREHSIIRIVSVGRALAKLVFLPDLVAIDVIAERLVGVVVVLDLRHESTAGTRGRALDAADEFQIVLVGRRVSSWIGHGLDPVLPHVAIGIVGIGDRMSPAAEARQPVARKAPRGVELEPLMGAVAKAMDRRLA